MPATPDDELRAPSCADRLPAAAAQEPPAGASKLPPSIASAFAAAAYALQHGDPQGMAAPDEASQAPGQGLMPGLYASMIGESSRDYYLPLFERFDALGKALPTWNYAAGLFTLPWCGLRGLWREAALYALAAGGAAALWGGLLRPALGLPPPIAHGIDATLVLLAIAIPGLGANALYWRHVRRHTLQAIGEAPNMAEAHARLARHAATPARKRLAVLAGGLLATAAAAAAFAWAVRTTATAVPQAAASALAPAAEASALAEAALQPIADTPPAAAADTAARAVEPPMPLPPATAEAPPPAPPASPVLPADVSATPDAGPGQMVAAPIEPMAAPPAAEPAKAAAAAPAHQAAPASRPSAPAPSAAPKTPPAKEPPAKAAPAKAEPAKPASAVLEPGNYYINIAVFSDAANADRVVARLEKARLPALRQTLNSNKGEIVRVRSGPFAQQRRAEQAAGKIRKMGLDATVFHHAPQQERAGRRPG